MLRILLTNDDGIDAPGLRALEHSVLHTIEHSEDLDRVELLTVAPDRCRSECGHSIESKRPLEIRRVSEGRHSVDGTPVDCVRVAICAMDFQPDLVLSGINAGANLGVNLMVSGTFAAAREANLLGFPSMAISHYRRPDIPKSWDHTPQWLRETLNEFIGVAMTDGANKLNAPAIQVPAIQVPLWNVNLPAIDPDPTRLPERTFCRVDRRPLDRSGRVSEDGQVHFELDFHGRPRERDRDVAHCFSGKITISRVGAHWLD